MSVSFKKTAIVIISLLGLAFAYQNCAQQPYGANGVSSNGSQSAGSMLVEVELSLSDNADPSRVVAGEYVKLTVNIEALGADAYEWVRILPFRGAEVIAITESGQYYIPSFQEADAGEYMVTAIFGQTRNESQVLTIQVIPPL